MLLLYNGRVLPPGRLSEDGAFYVLRQRAGTIRFPKRDVEKIFGSIQAVYQYKKSRLAPDDPDEHMSLAKWCLAMRMEAEARAELGEVMALNPGDHEAKAMLASLDAAADRASRPQVDPQVAQVGGGGAGAGGPGELDPGALRPPVARSAAPVGLPVIFDLPPALAVRRAQEFARYVHPELQRHCVRCHNERFAGRFQLIQVRTARDYQDQMLVRANLEAALQLVDPKNLPQSPLLTNSLLPHKPYNQPIFPSAKIRAYQYFETWVNSLKVAPPPEEVVAGAPGTGFGSDRAGPIGGGASAPAAPRPSAAPAEPPADRLARAGAAPGLPPGDALNGQAVRVPPPGQLLPETASGNGPYVPGNLEFPVPAAAGGPMALPALPQRASNPTLPAAAAPTSSPSTPAASAAPPAASPGATPNPSSPDPAQPQASTKTAKKKKRAIDPSALQKFLQNRNQ